MTLEDWKMGVIAGLHKEADRLHSHIGKQDDLIDELQDKLERVEEFKKFVHGWLDKAGVPTDPYPEKNKKTGCRVGCRLDWLKAQYDMSLMGTPVDVGMRQSIDIRVWNLEKAVADLCAWQMAQEMEGRVKEIEREI